MNTKKKTLHELAEMLNHLVKENGIEGRSLKQLL